MKSWEPEKVFKKPDFPVVRRDGESAGPARKQDQEKTPKKEAHGSPVDPPEQTAQPHPVRGEVIPRAEAAGVQAWTPGLDFKAPANPKPAAPENKIAVPDPARSEPAGGTWVPDLEFTRADFPLPAQKNGAALKRASTPPVRGTPANPSSAHAGTPPTQPVGTASLGETILKETVLAEPSRAVDQLRRWFWAKPGISGDNPALAQVQPHERIFIVLASLGKEITEYLFTMISPAERVRFQAILKHPYRPQAGQVQIVRRAFADAMRGDAR